MEHLEYLVSYGALGDFGRFRATRPLACRRGDRAVVRTSRGLEIGRVLRAAAPRHADFLPNTTVGQLLRRAADEDDATAERMRERGLALFDRGRRLAAELGLPLELLDVEVLLDGEHAVLHPLRWADGDVRPFVSTLSREFALYITMTDLHRAGEAMVEDEEEEHGCGKDDCGKGGCGSCGDGGCGSCGTAEPAEVKAHFADLREKMEQNRTALL